MPAAGRVEQLGSMVIVDAKFAGQITKPNPADLIRQRTNLCSPIAAVGVERIDQALL